MTFAQKLINKEVHLEGFNYYQDYVKTVALEAKLIRGKCLFIGGGPVPLTPILLKKNHNIDVDVLEYNNQAVQISQQLLNALKINMKIILGDAITFKGYGGYGTIHIALEAGPTEQTKKAIFKNIMSQINPSTELIIRGSSSFGGDEGFPHVEKYVGDFFQVKKKIPVFSDLSITYLLHCGSCPIGKSCN